MPCRKIISPITKQEVISKTWEDIYNFTKNEDKTDELYNQLSSDNFLSWFGDWISTPEYSSKVVNDLGEPLLVYHGYKLRDEQKEIRNFDKNLAPKGFYFTSSLSYSKQYNFKFAGINEVGLIPSFLSIKNPQEREDLFRDTPTKAIIEGYDGFVGNDAGRKEKDIFVAFEPNQIKSVFNRGDFSESSDIYNQVKEGPIPSKASPKTLSLVKEILNQLGVNTREVNNIVVNGKIIGANGIAKPFENLVEYVYGKEDIALPEEAMHIAVELLEQKNPTLLNSMLNQIDKYSLYREVFSTYKTIYTKDGKPDIRKIKKEAVAKLLVEQIIRKSEGFTEKPELLEKSGNFWDQIKEWLKGLLNTLGFDVLDNFERAAKIIISSPETLKDTSERSQLATFAGDLQSQLDNLIANKSEILDFLERSGFGKSEIYLVGGRTTNKDLKSDSDLDLIIKVEKTPFDNTPMIDRADNRIIWMERINKEIWKNGKDIHILNHFSKESPNGRILSEGLLIDFPNKVPGDVFLQISDNQKPILDRLDEVGKRITKVYTKNENPIIDESTDNFYEIEGKRVKRRITDRVKDWYKRKFGEKTFSESQKRRNEILRNFGTSGHKDLEDIFRRYIDDSGNKRTQVLNEKTISTSPKVYEKLEEYFSNFLGQFPDSTKFKSEQIIFKPGKGDSIENGEAGTIDFLAIKEDGTAEIFDWKFMSNQGEDVQWYKQNAYDIQLNGYESVLKSNYGVTKIGRKRAIPFLINTTYVRQTDTTVVTGIAAGSANVEDIEDLRLLPVASKDERTGIPVIDTYIDKLFSLYEKISNVTAKEGERSFKNEQLNTIMRTIRLLQVKQDLSQLAKEAVVLSKNINRTIENYNIKFKGKNYSDFSQEEIEEFSEQLIEAIDFSNIYNNIDIEFKKLLVDTGNEDADAKLLEIRNDLREAADRTRELKGELKEVLDEFSEKFIANRFSISDLMKPERVVNYLVRNFRAFSKSKTKASRLLYRLTERALQEVEITTNEFNTKLLDLRKEFGDKPEVKFKKLFQTREIKGEKVRQHRLVYELSREFYDKFEKARENKDISFFRDNIDLDAYREEAKKRIERDKKRIDEREFYGTEEEVKNQRKREKDKIDRSWNIDIKDSEAWGNWLMRKSVIKELWYSSEFKEILKDPALLKFYNLIKSLNEKAVEIGYLDKKEESKFLPFVYNTFSEKLTLGGSTSLMTQFFNSISSSESELNYGAVDPISKKPVLQIPKYFTQDLGEQLSYEEDGITKYYTDYSNVSQDLFKLISLYQEQLTKFEKISNLENQAKMLLYVEENKDSIVSKKLGGVVLEAGRPKIQKGNETNKEYYERFLKAIIYDQKYTDEGFDQSLGKWSDEKAKKINNFLRFKLLPEDLGEREFSFVKTIDASNRAFQLKTLGLNLGTGLSNLIGGQFQAFINAGKYFNSREFFSAETQLVTGSFQNKEGNIQFKLLDYFLPMNELLEREQTKKLSTGVLNQHSISDFIMVMQRNADKFIQYSIANAFIKNMVVIDGKIYNAREYLRNQEEFRDRYSKGGAELRRIEREFPNKVAELIKSNGIANKAKIVEGKLEIEGINRLDETVLANREKMRLFASQATGNLSNAQFNQIRMSVVGRSFMVFKNWIPQMVDTRFGELTYNEGTEAHEWGRFRMTMKYVLKEPIKSFGKFAHILRGDDLGIQYLREFYETKAKEHFDKTGEVLDISSEEFNDLFRQNLKSMLKDMLFVTSTMGLLISMKLLPPDDEDKETKNYYRMGLRYLDKISDEVAFYYNPTSLNSILNGSVFPSLGLFTDAGKVVTSLTSDLLGDDEKTQSVKYLLKAFPVTKEFVNFLPFISEDLSKELDVRVSSQSRRQ